MDAPLEEIEGRLAALEETVVLLIGVLLHGETARMQQVLEPLQQRRRDERARLAAEPELAASVRMLDRIAGLVAEATGAPLHQLVAAIEA